MQFNLVYMYVCYCCSLYFLTVDIYYMYNNFMYFYKCMQSLFYFYWTTHLCVYICFPQLFSSVHKYIVYFVYMYIIILMLYLFSIEQFFAYLKIKYALLLNNNRRSFKQNTNLN